MNLTALEAVSAGDDDELTELFDTNSLLHESIFGALLSQGLVISHLPLFVDYRNDDAFVSFLDWHDRSHRAIASALNIDSPPPLTSVDIQDQSALDVWMQYHFQHHLLISQTLGF